MKYITLILIAILTLTSCEKDPIEDITIPPTMTIEPPTPKTDETTNPPATVTPSNPATGTPSETTQVESGTTTETTEVDPKDEGTESTTATETTEVDPKDEGTETVEVETATVTDTSASATDLRPGEYIDTSIVAPQYLEYIKSFDDGKGNIGHTYRVVNSGSTRVIAIGVDNGPADTAHQVLFSDDRVIDVDDGLSIQVYTAEFITVEHRDVTLYVQSDYYGLTEGYLNTLDEALDLTPTWSTDVIYYINPGAAYTFYSGLAGGTEFIIAGNVGTHTLIHEDGHNYDVQNSGLGEAINPFFNLASQVSQYATTAISEYRADVYAYYYYSRGNLPTLIVAALDLLFG